MAGEVSRHEGLNRGGGSPGGGRDSRTEAAGEAGVSGVVELGGGALPHHDFVVGVGVEEVALLVVVVLLLL